jgi:hypothetical protein
MQSTLIVMMRVAPNFLQLVVLYPLDYGETTVDCGSDRSTHGCIYADCIVYITFVEIPVSLKSVRA